MECRGSILVVDDEIGPRESIRMIMKPDHRIVTADCGRTALQCLSKESFDLVTLDLNMGDMHGIEVLKRIRAMDEDVQVVVVTGYGTLTTAQQAIRYGIFDYITKPFEIEEILSVVNKAICKKRLQEQMRNVMSDLQKRCDEAKTKGGKEACLADGLSLPLKQSFSLYRDLSLIDFIQVLSRTLEEKNLNMHQHSERVNYYSQIVAEAMGLSLHEQENLRLAAFLHDIGKVGISNDILNKRGNLTRDEWEEIKDHPRRGVEIVKPLPLPVEVLDIIMHHHESYEGGGYPKGLRGKEIPLSARIIRIVDSYDAMISNRPYRKAQQLEWVIKEIISCSGTHFDPEISEIFIDILSRQDAICPAEFFPSRS